MSSVNIYIVEMDKNKLVKALFFRFLKEEKVHNEWKFNTENFSFETFTDALVSHKPTALINNFNWGKALVNGKSFDWSGLDYEWNLFFNSFSTNERIWVHKNKPFKHFLIRHSEFFQKK